jgi:dTDP-4-amino-4,6-dideoxygalactose transaminase
MGDIACFSFYPGKNLGAYGEAGAVVTNNADYAHQVKLLRDHGQREKYLHDVIGYNYRMEAIQGAVLKVKLRHLDEWTLVRRQQAEAYGELLSGTGLRLLEEIPDGKCVYHIFPVFTEQRDELQQHLKSAGVATGIHYPIPAHLQHAFEHLGYKAGDLPQTERASKEMLSLPIYPELPGNALSHIASSIRQFCEQTIAAHS